jgi:hypothetical protein
MSTYGNGIKVVGKVAEPEAIRPIPALVRSVQEAVNFDRLTIHERCRKEKTACFGPLTTAQVPLQSPIYGMSPLPAFSPDLAFRPWPHPALLRPMLLVEGVAA